MPNAALLALSVTTPGTRPWSLTIGGTDVTIGPAGGTAWGVPVDTIHLDEQGPGGVSSMAFRINDPSGALFPADGQLIEYRDVTNGAYLHRGFVDSWDSAPAFGDQGRKIDVRSIGIDCLLDWDYVPPIVIPPGSSTSAAIAMLANLYAPELIAPPVTNLDLTGGPGFPPASIRNGNAAWPLGFLQNTAGTANALTGIAQSWPGGSLRQAILSCVAQSVYIGSGGQIVEVPSVFVAIDPQYRLRLWCTGPTDQPDDYTTLIVTDTAAGALRAENLKYGGDPGNVIRQCHVIGAGGVVWGPFSDGTGIRGREDAVNDATITTGDQAQGRAAQFLAENSGKVRGTFDLLDWTPSALTVHAGSLVTITDAASNATGTYRIYQIERTFNNSGRQNWHVAFGGREPSLANLTRRLTRTLN